MDNSKIFSSKSVNLVEFINNLTTAEIKNCCESVYYERGKDYFESKAIKEFEYISENKIIAEVSGSEYYKVEIGKNENSVFASCSCPFNDDVCKHTIAVLLYAQKNKSQNKNISTENNVDIFDKHLESLSKSELIKLVQKYAPSDYKKTIVLKQSAPRDSENEFKRITDAIEDLLDDEDVLYNPERFETRLMKRINALKPILSIIPLKISDYLLELMEKIDDLQDEGYLWFEGYNRDGYYDEVYFEGDEFCKFIAHFIKIYPEEHLFEFKQKLFEIQSQCSHSSFGSIEDYIGKFFDESNLELLKTNYLQSVKNSTNQNDTQYFKKIKSIINEEEKELILFETYKKESSLLFEFLEFLKTKERNKEALKILSDCLNENIHNYKHSDLKKEQIILSHKLNLPVKTFVIELFEKETYFSTLEFALKYLPEEKENLEKTLKSKNISQYFKYLEKKMRLEEAHQLILENTIEDNNSFFSNKISESDVNEFYSKNKTTFTTHAEKFFINTIRKNEKSTGDTYYDNIYKALQQIKSINPNKVQEIVFELKDKYKRRTNLIKLLNKL